MKYTFNQAVRRFRCGGIEMIGNTHTGVLIGLDSDGAALVDAIQSQHSHNLSTPGRFCRKLLQALTENGFFSEKTDAVLNMAYMHVTSRCTLKCIGCYSDEPDRNNKTNLTTEQYLRILDNLHMAGVSHLVISGGEPLLREDLAYLLAYAKQKLNCAAIQVISNGTASLEKYKKILPYADLISISVDGYNDATSFLRNSNMPAVLNTVRALSELTCKLRMVFTLCAKNLQFIPEYLSLSKKLQIPCTFSLLTVPSSAGLEEYALRKEHYEMLCNFVESAGLQIEDAPVVGTLGCRESCGVGRRIVSIAANGDIYPCHMLHDSSLKMGNALNDNLALCLKRASLSWDVECVRECSSCKYKYLCGGGCYARRYYDNKDICASHDPCCQVYQNNFERELDRALKY